MGGFSTRGTLTLTPREHGKPHRCAALVAHDLDRFVPSPCDYHLGYSTTSAAQFLLLRRRQAWLQAAVDRVLAPPGRC